MNKDLSYRPCRITITLEGYREDVISAALKSLSDGVTFDSPSGSGSVLVEVDTVAKFPPYPTGKMHLSVDWCYTVEKPKQ